MMAPDYAHWHGMYEVAERFYMELIPQAREIAEHAEQEGFHEKSQRVHEVIDKILDRPEHKWFEEETGKRDKVALGQADLKRLAKHLSNSTADKN